MPFPRSVLLWLLVLTVLPLKAQAPSSFVTQVESLLRSNWTELRITQASMSDTGEISGVTLQLSREKAGSPIFYRADVKSEQKPLSPAQFQSLQDTLLTAAREVEAIQTASEILDSVSPTEAAKLIREGKINQNEITELIIACIKPIKTAPLSNGGSSATLSLFLEKELLLKTHKLSR